MPHAVARRGAGQQRQAMAVLEALRAEVERLEGRMDGDGDIELDRRGEDRIMGGMPVRTPSSGEGHDEGAAAAVLYRAAELGCCGLRIAQRQMRDRNRPPG